MERKKKRKREGKRKRQRKREREGRYSSSIVNPVGRYLRSLWSWLHASLSRSSAAKLWQRTNSFSLRCIFPFRYVHQHLPRLCRCGCQAQSKSRRRDTVSCNLACRRDLNAVVPLCCCFLICFSVADDQYKTR